MKSKGVAYFLWLISIFGWLGFHRFYLGKIGTGIIWMLTAGLFGIGAFIDLFTLGGKVEQYNTKVELKTLRSTSNEMARMTAHNMAQREQEKMEQKQLDRKQ